jgi:RpiR family carbohydrate utilization transcriptional regulator
MDVLATTRIVMADLRNSEKKVAEYLLKHPESVIGKSITSLADDVGTSEPTIIRFCRKLGLSGYMDLKMNLARNLPSRRYIHETVQEGDLLPEIFNKLFKSAMEAFNRAMTRLDLSVIEAAAQALASARKIEFYGVGGSGVVARDAHHKFFRLGVPCNVYDDPHMQIMSAALLSAGDVVVAISHTGSTKDIIDAVKMARACEATVIGITGEGKTPLSRLCHFAISVESKEAALRLAPMTSRLVQLTILDVLFVSVAMHNLNDTREKLDRVKQSLVEKRF